MFDFLGRVQKTILYIHTQTGLSMQSWRAEVGHDTLFSPFLPVPSSMFNYYDFPFEITCTIYMAFLRQFYICSKIFTTSCPGKSKTQ